MCKLFSSDKVAPQSFFTPAARNTPEWCTGRTLVRRVDADRRYAVIRAAWIRNSRLPVAACRKKIASALREPGRQIPDYAGTLSPGMEKARRTYQSRR